MKRRFLFLAYSFGAAFLLLLTAAGCSAPAEESAPESTVQAVWDARLVSLVQDDDDAAALAESLAAGNDPDAAGGFTNAEAPGDGTVVVTYTEAQAAAAIDDLSEKLSSTQSAFSEDFPGCSLEISDDCRSLRVELTQDIALSEGFGAANAASAALLAQYRMVQKQLLTDTGPWSLTTELYDADDGRLIKTYTDEFSLDYASADWEAPA